MKALFTFFLLAILTNVCHAQWREGESMVERKAAHDNRSTEPGAPLPSLNQAVSPSGKFIIKPDNSGRLNFDSTLAQNFKHAIDSIGNKYSVRGMSAAVLIPGQGIWLGTYGYSTTPPDSIRSETLFNIGSQTKTFTSALVLKLVEEGRLSLDDSIGRWLSPLANISPQITVRQLLNHTSGLYDYVNDSQSWYSAMIAEPNRNWSQEELLATFLGAPHSPPGGPFYYSNTNYTVAGMIIRNITGTNISTQLHQRIFAPHVLTSIFLCPEDTVHGVIAHPWSNGSDFSFFYGPAVHTSMWTWGAIYSTAEDMARWVNALYGGQVLTPASLVQMQTCVPEPPEWIASGAGIIWISSKTSIDGTFPFWPKT